MKANIEIEFHATDLPGGADAILGPSECGPDVVKLKPYTWEELGGLERLGVRVEITLDERDPRVSKVFALLDQYGVERWVDRKDVYTEDELQAAPLLVMLPWQGDLALGYRTYDDSKACPTCKAGLRQTSTLKILRVDRKVNEKFRLAFTHEDDVLVHDVDVERLLAAGVTGALFWPVEADTKAGDMKELRRQQMIIEHVMPPMSPKSFLDRTRVCADCGRGWHTGVMGYPTRFVYRREDLANIHDVNLTWEWFGGFWPEYNDPEDIRKSRGEKRPSPDVLVTPKVMNIFRDAGVTTFQWIPVDIEG